MADLAEVADPQEYDAEVLARALYGEAAQGSKRGRRGISDTMFNDLDTGYSGSERLDEVLRKRLTAVRTNSKQYQKASDPSSRNDWEEGKYQEILSEAREVVGERYSGKWKSTVGKARHFEHVKANGMPDGWLDRKSVV